MLWLRELVRTTCALAILRTERFPLTNPQTRKLTNPPTRKPANPLTYFTLLCIPLLISGCSSSYQGERLFWHAQRLAIPILNNPTDVTAGQLSKAVAAFQKVVKHTPDTIWAARAHAAIGSLYVTQREFDKAREAYFLVLENYHQHRALVLACRVSIAKTYEMEKDWEKAVKVYEEIPDQHPWTQMGLETPLYIAKTYAERKESDKATRAYERAIRRYLRLIPTAPSRQKELQVKGYLASAYLNVGEGQQAIDLFEELLADGKNISVNRPVILLMMGRIYEIKLHNREKANQAYATLIAEFPDHALAAVAKRQLEQNGYSSEQPASVTGLGPMVPQVPQPGASTAP